jgi:magnesium transporter
MRKPKKLRSQKAGLPPGSLVAIGEQKTAAASLTLFDYDSKGCAESSPANLQQLARANPQFQTRWANFYGSPQPEVLAEIGNTFDLHPLVQEDILNNAQRQKVDTYTDSLYIVLHRYELHPDSLELTQDQISLVCGRDFLLSFQERQSQTFEPVRQRLRAERSTLRRSGVDMLTYSLLDAVVDSYFAIVEQLNDRAELLEDQILGRPRPSALEGIHQLKRCVSQLRRNLHPLRELLGSLHRDNDDFFAAETRLYLRDVYDHTIHIIESLEDLRDLSTSLLDVYLSTVSHRVNLQVRTLTMIATIFMPASLLAGIFGMNFHVMPWIEQPAGFLYAMGLMGSIATVMLLILLRRKRD